MFVVANATALSPLLHYEAATVTDQTAKPS